MNDNDIDIILALAEGRLSGQAKQNALDHIAAHPELGAELVEQTSAISELQSMPGARMTEQERANLRSNLIEQLHLAPVTAAPALKQRGAWWQPVFGLTSVAALVLAVVIVPGMLAGSDDSSSQIVAVTDGSSSDSDGSDASDRQEFTAAAPADASGDTVSVPLIAESDVAEFFDSAANLDMSALAQAESEREDQSDAAAEDDAPELEDEVAADMGEDAPGDLDSSTVAFDLTALESCLAGLAPHPSGEGLTPHAATPTDDGHLLHLGVETDTGVDYALSIDPTTCAVVSINP